MNDNVAQILRYFIVVTGIVGLLATGLYFLNEVLKRDQEAKLACVTAGGIYSVGSANTCIWSKSSID